MGILFNLLLLLPLFSAGTSADHGATSLELEKEILKDIYRVSKFHMLVRPPNRINATHDGPVNVQITMYVLNVDANTAKQECNVNLYFRQEWNDSRLMYDNHNGMIDYVSTHDVTGFWAPDTFFVHEKYGHFHTITKPNNFFKIYPDGRILYSQRLSLTLASPMQLEKYPFDTQTCSITVESYGYTAKDTVINWKADAVNGGVSSVPGYTLSYSPSSEVLAVSGQKYSRASLDIHLTRETIDFIYHIYIPAFLLVIISWASFWLKPKFVLQRLTLSLTAAACTLFQFYSNSHLFVSAYCVTALDIYTSICTAFVFAAFLQNIYVSTGKKNHVSNNEENGYLNSAGVKLLNPEKGDVENQLNVLKLLLNKLSRRIPTADVTARIAFPVLFIIFNIAYFSRLVLYSDNE